LIYNWNFFFIIYSKLFLITSRNTKYYETLSTLPSFKEIRRKNEEKLMSIKGFPFKSEKLGMVSSISDD